MPDHLSAVPRSARRTSLSLALITALIAAPLALAPVTFASADEVVGPAAAEAVVETVPVVTEPASEPAPESAPEPEPAAELPVESPKADAPEAQGPVAEDAAPGTPGRTAESLPVALPTPTFTATTTIDSITFTWDQHMPVGENWNLQVEVGDPDMPVNGWGLYGDYQQQTTVTIPYPKHTPVIFRVRSASQTGGVSGWATSDTLVVGEAPGEVPNLGFVPTAGGLILRWMYPSEGSGNMVVDVQYRKSTVDDSAAWISAPANAWNLTGLSGGVEYEVRVRGTNPVGSSAWRTASATTLETTPPSVPTSVSAASSLGSVSILWSAPAAAGSSDVTGYEWAWKLHSQDDTEWTQVAATNSPGTRFTSTIQLHDLRVRAVNQAGPGPWSDTVSAIPQTIFIPPMLPTAPGTPTNLVLTGADSTISASWTAATGTVTSYSVSVTTSDEAARTFTQTMTSLEITGLTNSKQYLVTVTPFNTYMPGPAVSEYGRPYTFAPVFTLADGSSATGARLTAGDKVTISGTGAIPLYTVYAELHSDPIALGNTMTAGDGSFSFTVTIPKSASAGAHSLYVYLAGDDGIAADTAISVTIPAILVVAADGSETLAITGADPSSALWLALVALLTGIALTVRSRRRSV